LIEQLWSVAAHQGIAFTHFALTMCAIKLAGIACRSDETFNLRFKPRSSHKIRNAVKKRSSYPEGDSNPYRTVGEQLPSAKASHFNSEQIRSIIRQSANELQGVSDVTVFVHNQDIEGISVSFHCRMDPNIPIKDAHGQDGAIRASSPNKNSSIRTRVVIHLEPSNEENQ
jgi:hypothetical protein